MTHERANEIIAEASACMTSEPVSTSRVFLRPFSESDFEDYFEYASQRELQRLSGNYEISTRAEAHESFDFILKQNRELMTRFAIVFKETGKVIGNFCINIYPFLMTDEALGRKKGISISLVLNERFQRRGLMTELLKRVISFFLIEHGFDYVNSGYFWFNEGSRKIQERAGMKPYMDHIFKLNGKDILVNEMIVFREDVIGRN